MEQLGNDELFCIVKRIQNQHDLLSFSQVSKQFLKVACVRRRTLLNSFTDILHDVLPASPNLRNFQCSKPLSNKHMKLLAESCPKLTRLDLGIKKKLDPQADSEPSVVDFDDDGLCIMGSACIHLVDVNLKGRSSVRDVEVGSLVRSFKNLKILSLKRCVNVTDESLKTIGEANYLKSLTLDGCFLITDLGLEFLANGNVKNCLRLLSLSKCNRISDN
nr:hypothetical protein [Tanacetum cinerariifolium]